jgi:hypothetical protein
VLLEFGTPVVIGIGGVIAATAMIVATQTPRVTTASPVSLIASSPPAPAQQASRPSAR